MNSLKQTLLAKLRRPIYISFISKYLVRLPMSDTMDIINEMVQEELIEESKYGKGYYVLKTKTNE